MSMTAAASAALASLLDCQRRVLEHIATRSSYPDCVAPCCSPTPSIPEDYKIHIAPYLAIAPDMGSCGTAADLRKPVHTRDSATDPLWHECGEIAVRNGLRAIWSTPILGDDNTVLGTFAMYYGEPRLPDPQHIQLIDMATQMARVAIETRRSEAALRDRGKSALVPRCDPPRGPRPRRSDDPAQASDRL